MGITKTPLAQESKFRLLGFLGCHLCLLAEDSLCSYGIMEVLPSFQAREKGPAGSLTLLF